MIASGGDDKTHSIVGCKYRPGVETTDWGQRADRRCKSCLVTRWEETGCQAATNRSSEYGMPAQVEEVLEIKGFGGWVTSVVWSPDGQELASAGGDSIIHLWDTNTGLELFKLEGHQDFISGLSWTGDGERVASSSADGTVRIWDD